MSTLSDHVTRDALDAARSYIRVQLNRFQRRIYETAKADIQLTIESAEAGETVEGLAIGAEAAERAFSSFLSTDEPQPAIEATPVKSAKRKAAKNSRLRPRK